MADSAYESVLLVKNEVFVYKIPPRPSNRGYRAADWKLDAPDWTGRLRVVALNKNLFIKLENKDGELFAQCPVEDYPSAALESVMDSSRYFVIRIKDDSGRSAFIGIGFADRSDSFDLNVSIQDHFKWLKQEKEAEKATKELLQGPSLDLGFKAGQTITLNIGAKKGEAVAKPRPKPRAAGGASVPGAFLPPPPGSGGAPPPIKIPPAPGGGGGGGMAAPPSPPPSSSSSGFGSGFGSGSGSAPPASQQQQQGGSESQSSNVDLLLELGPSPPSNQNQSTIGGDAWGDFTAAPPSSNSTQAAFSSSSNSDSGGGWVQF